MLVSGNRDWVEKARYWAPNPVTRVWHISIQISDITTG